MDTTLLFPRKFLIQYCTILQIIFAMLVACGRSGGGDGPAPLPPIVGLQPLTNFKAFANPTDVTLHWQYSKAGDTAKIVRKTTGYPSSPSDGTQIYQGSATQYTDSALTTGKYYYAAFATNDADGSFAESRRLTAVSYTHLLPPI